MPGTSHRYAVIAILDEIDIADLKDVYGRQVGLAAQRVDARPALGIDVAAGQKGAVKVTVAADAADDSLQRDLLERDILLWLPEVELLLDICEGEQVIGAPGQFGQYVLHECAPPCSVIGFHRGGSGGIPLSSGQGSVPSLRLDEPAG